MASTSNALLLHAHSFGLKGSVNKNVAYMDEQNVVYPCGHSIVIHNAENREQQFITGLETSDGITAMAVSPNKRFVLVTERADKAIGTIFDLTTLRKRKVLSYPDIGSTQYVSVAFSSDNKLCLTQGGAPEWNLVVWSWEKVKVIGTIKTTNQVSGEVYNVDFCPNDNSVVCVSGNGIIKFFKMTDGQLRQQQLTLKRDPPNFVCHTWLSDDRLVAASDMGEIWLFENFEFRLILSSQVDETIYINSLCTFSKGFLCGGHEGVLRIYERSDDMRECYRCTKVFTIEGTTSSISSMAVSPTEDNMICSLQSNQMYVLNLANSDILKEDAMNFELFSTSFHSPGPNGAHITGLDVCVRKPLIVTCGLDHTVRVWNYIEKTTELIKEFREEAFSVAFHPSGLHILVGLSDKLRFMNLLMDDIRAVKEVPIKTCREVRFSNGGQYFAAANNNSIQVYSTYSNEMIAALRGHTNRVTAICWKPNDKKLITSGLDGAIITWNLRTGQKDDDGFSNPRYQFFSAVVTNDMNSIYASASDCTIREIDVVTGMVRFELDTGIQLGPICLSSSQKLMFCGTTAPDRPGNIRTYRLPFTPGTSPSFVDLPCHDMPVTQLRLSTDNQYLFATSEDGSLTILETKELQNRTQGRGRERETPMYFAEEILVTRSDLEEKTQKMHELKVQVDELTLHNEYQLRLKDMNYKEKIKEVSEKFTAELDQDRERYFELRNDKRDMESEYEDKMRELEDRRQKEINDLETSYKSKIGAETDRYHALIRERDEQNTVWEEENQMLVENHTQFLAEMTSEYDGKVEQEQSIQEKLAKQKDEMITEFEESRNQLEEDADFEIEELKAKYDTKLSAEREATLRLKGENGIMKKKFSALQKDIEDQKEEIRSLQEKEKELFENIKGLEKDIHGHKKEIREREETIQDKEKRIYDLKKKNQELEKFKFVLDYKIKELKRQIEPRENEITEMRQQIEEMDLELEQYHRSNAALDLMIGELRLKMDGMQKELSTQKKQLAEGESLIHRFQLDLNECGNHIDNGKRLKPIVIQLYKKYVQDQSTSSNSEINAQQESNRQREYLEKSVESMKRKIAKDQKARNKEGHRLLRENAALTKESNQLRREYHLVLQEQQGLTQQAAPIKENTRKSSIDWKQVEAQKKEIEALEKHLSELKKVAAGPLMPDMNESHICPSISIGDDLSIQAQIDA